MLLQPNTLKMPSISPLFLILGLVVASVTAAETSTSPSKAEVLGMPTVSLSGSTQFPADNSMSTPVTPSINTSVTTSMYNSITTAATSEMNTSLSTVIRSTTEQGGYQTNGDHGAKSTTPKMMTARPTSSTKATASTKTKDIVEEKPPTAKPQGDSGDTIGIIILVVIIIVAFVFGLACYFARKRGRRYSVDFNSRPDDAHIPLSTVEPEAPADTVPQNGLKTFESVETAAEESQEPEAKPEVKEEQKAEPDKSAVDPGAESAAPPPSPDNSEQDKPKEDIAEPSPPPPVESTLEEKTDDEGTVSNKTSVESLKETNENNSNNADCSKQGDLQSSNLFWDVPLNCPV